MNILDSKILITGANRGIGLSLVDKALAQGAAKIYATYRSQSNLSVLEAYDERVVPIYLDLGDKSTMTKLPELVPSLNILINNAGIFTAESLLEDTGIQLRNDLETNFFGTLAVTKALLPILEREQAAAIINISSIAGLAAMPSFGGYSVSKAAIHSMTQSIRGKLKASDISVHGVYPGPVATRLTEDFDMETTAAPVVAENILNGVAQGIEEIFPDTLSQQVGPLFLSSPKSLEQNFAEF